MVAALRHLGERLVALAAVPPAHDDDVLDAGAVGHRLVGDALERQDLAAAVAAVGRDQDGGRRVLDPVPERLGREAAEDHRVHGTDPRAGQHRDRGLRYHREVDRDAVALPDAEALQRVGRPADFTRQRPVGVDAAVARLPFPDDRGLVPARAREVAVEAIGRDVEPAAVEPARVGGLPVEHARPRRHPVERPGLFLPEGEPVPGGRVVQRLRGDGVGGELGRRGKAPAFVEKGVELVCHRGTSSGRVGSWPGGGSCREAAWEAECGNGAR